MIGGEYVVTVNVGSGVGKDMKYYKGIFINAGCPPMIADTLARGHLGMEMLSQLETNIKNALLQGYPYETALSLARDESAWEHYR